VADRQLANLPIDRTALRVRRTICHHSFDQLLELDRRLLRLGPANARKSKQIIYEIAHAGSGIENRRDVVPAFVVQNRLRVFL
jgi:hypothetical protein